MSFESKKWGNVATWVIAIAAVLVFFPENVRIFLAVVAIVGVFIVCVVMIARKILPKSIKQRKFVKSAKGGFIFRLLTQIMVAGIFVSTISFLFSDNIPVVLGEVIKKQGTKIAKKTEECILECIRENNEKVMITLADSEEVRNVIYRDALFQAQDKNKGGYIYIDSNDKRYRTSNNWIEIPFTLIDDITPGEKKLVLRLKDERGEKVSLRSNKVQAYLSDEQKILLSEKIGNNSILLTEDERNIIKDCLKKYKGQDLYSLMYSVLNDPNMLKELRRKKAYDVEYYEFRLPGKDKPIAKGEKKVKLSNSYIIIEKTTKHLTPYEKISIIGCYIDELR